MIYKWNRYTIRYAIKTYQFCKYNKGKTLFSQTSYNTLLHHIPTI